ncbi:MAG: LamG domain-containing protein [Niabella sp.]
MKTIYKLLLITFIFLSATGCQKMDRPALGDYPKDATAPGGPLKFYVAFDGTTDDPLMNAVDSMRANFPSDNPLPSTDGVNGKGVMGATGQYIKYAQPNDWATTATSFTVALWYKGSAQTKNNKGTNGPEYLMTLKAVSDYHWSNASMFFFLEGSNTSCAIKLMTVDKNKADHWFEWVGTEAPAGLLDNQWHHIAFVYDAASSTATLYLNGVAHTSKKTWNGHGSINFDDTKISEMRIGCGPNNDATGDDWLASSWKGSLDQFRLYGTALTAAEVLQLYNNKQ